MQQHCKYLVKLFLLISTVCGVNCLPASREEVKSIFTGTKRDVTTSGPAAASTALRSAIYNPYMYPFAPFIPGKPFFYPLLTPPELLLNRFTKSTTGDTKVTSGTSSIQATNPVIGSYFKSKKDEFLAKLFEKIAESSETADITARSLTSTDADPTVKPTIDPNFFLNKKLDFLDKLFKTLNATATTTAATSPVEDTTTPKPTIVPPNFWFPFVKPPKPPKAPKPTKPPKTKKLLKDALDAAILQSLLLEFGVDPNSTTSKRAATAVPGKKAKSKKVKSDADLTEFHIPPKVDPALYSAKASDCLDKLFKILSKADAEDLSTFIEPKATVIPTNMWTQPSETEYTSKLDAFLDLLLKSLNATDNSSKSKNLGLVPKKIYKRSTFLDELLHRVPPTPPSTTDVVTPSSGCDCSKKPYCGSDCTPPKAPRSLIFKPFGTGYWIPQYLYAAKMSLYLDKLMDTINSAAAEDVTPDGTTLKRSLTPSDDKINITGMAAKEAALTLLISELTDVKNDIVEAFGDGLKAQKSSTPSKPYVSSAKSFKKPFWGPKASPTPDPMEQIQKRIDVLNDIFDKLTEVEKTLIFSTDPEDKKILENINDTLVPESKIGSVRVGASKFSKVDLTKSSESSSQDASETPEYYIEKTRDFLQSLYANKFGRESE